MVEPGELFFTDAFQYEFSKDEYLCFEITFSGCRIPYHEESLLPAYILTDCGWQYSKKLPFPAMIGCDRKVTESLKVDFVFNNVPYLCESIENSNVAKYGGHPNNSGCEVWG